MPEFALSSAPRRARRVIARASSLAVLSLVALLAACGPGDASTAPGARGPAGLALALEVHAAAASSVELRATFAGTGGQPVELARETIPHDDPAPPIRFAIDLAPCLAATGQTGCDVSVQVTLLRDDLVLDRQAIGPIRLVPGEATTVAQPIALHEVSRVEIAPAATGPRTIETSDTLQLSAAALDASGAPIAGRTIEWTSAAPTVASVDASGRVVALSPGTTDISASSGGRTAVTTVAVVRPAVRTLDLSAPATHLDAGATLALIATPRDKRGTALVRRDVVFASSDVAVATVSAAGVVTGLAPGAVTITATSEGITARLELTVVPGAPASVVIAPRPPQLEQGESAQLSATVEDVRGNPVQAAVTWQSTSSTIATVSANGLVTAVSPSTTPVRIIASTPGTGGALIADTLVLTVVPVAVASVAVALDAQAIGIGALAHASATLTDRRGQPVTGRQVAWQSSAPGVATVDAAGVVTGVAPGSATIIATAGGVQGSATIQVVSNQPASVVITPGNPTVASDFTLQLQATAYDALGHALPNATFVWSSSDPTVADVDSTGLVLGGFSGTAVITADAGTASGSTTVTVIFPTFTSYFGSDTASAVVPFGGAPNCSYTQQFTSVDIFLDIVTPGTPSSSVQAMSQENVVGTCGTPPIPSNLHDYFSTSISIVGSQVSISYAPSSGNAPQATATFVGTIDPTGQTITGTLTFQRIDQTGNLNWTVSMPMTMQQVSSSAQAGRVRRTIPRSRPPASGTRRPKRPGTR
jgi:uncharacterized protein YjdB